MCLMNFMQFYALILLHIKKLGKYLLLFHYETIKLNTSLY